MPTQVIQVSSTKAFEATAPDAMTVTVLNLGPDSCYYATAATVSSGSNDGTLTLGSSMTFIPSKFFISAGTSRLQVTPQITSVYQLARERGGVAAAALSGPGVRVMIVDGGPVTISAAAAGRAVFHLKAGLWTTPQNPSIKLNLAFSMVTNAQAPVATFTAYLAPVTASAGASGTNSITLGTTVLGSTATITTPAANSPDVYAESGDFAIPADGAYALGFNNDATTAAGSDVTFRALLMWRWA